MTSYADAHCLPSIFSAAFASSPLLPPNQISDPIRLWPWRHDAPQAPPPAGSGGAGEVNQSGSPARPCRLSAALLEGRGGEERDRTHPDTTDGPRQRTEETRQSERDLDKRISSNHQWVSAGSHWRYGRCALDFVFFFFCYKLWHRSQICRLMV